MTVELPEGWARTTIGELGRYVNGRGFKKSEWSEEGIPIIRIQNLTGSSDKFNYFSGDLDPRHAVEAGDLLLSWAATLGVYEWDGPRAALNQHIFKVESFIDKRFHRYLLETLIDQLYRESHGSGMVHITRGKFESLEVGLPPLEEQLRIVAALEVEMSRLNSAVGSLGRVVRRERILGDSAFRSSLARVNCRHVVLSDVLSEKIVNGRSVRTRPGGFPVLKLDAIKASGVDVGVSKEGDWGEDEARPFLVRKEDFLLSRGNGTLGLVGRGAIVSEEPGLIAFPDTMMRIRLDRSVVLLDYFNLLWNSRYVRMQIESMARTTAGIYKINQSLLRGVEIPLPSLGEQREIVDNVRGYANLSIRLSGNVSLAQERSKRLSASLFSAAFAGKLVPQDPSDEPASELLSRIRAEKTVVSKSKRGPKKIASQSPRKPLPIPEDPRPVPAGEQTALEI